MDGVGAEGQAEGDVVGCVGFGGVGDDGGVWDRELDCGSHVEVLSVGTTRWNGQLVTRVYDYSSRPGKPLGHQLTRNFGRLSGRALKEPWDAKGNDACDAYGVK